MMSVTSNFSVILMISVTFARNRSIKNGFLFSQSRKQNEANLLRAHASAKIPYFKDSPFPILKICPLQNNMRDLSMNIIGFKDCN